VTKSSLAAIGACAFVACAAALPPIPVSDDDAAEPDAKQKAKTDDHSPR
jgi:hypothetical protein